MEKDRTEKKFWEVVCEGRKRRGVISKMTTDREWLDHFRQPFGGEAGEARRREEGIRREFEGEITEEEDCKVVKKLKNRKAPGEDRIKNEAWKAGWEKLKGPLTYCLNEAWKKKGKMPESWRKGRVKPIYKKGNPDQVAHYRGIPLMNTAYRIYTEILRRRLS